MKLLLSLGGMSAVNLGLIFLFQWCIVTGLGAGSHTDALFAGMTIPQLALVVISGSLTRVLVPILASENPADLRQDTWGFVVIVGAGFSLVALILFFGAPYWVPWTVPGFDQETLQLATELTRIQLLGLVLAAVIGVQSASYFARGQFQRVELSLALSNLLALAVLLWALPRYGVSAAAWIVVGRLALQALALVIGMGRPSIPDINRDSFRTAWRRVKPLIVGNAYYKTDPLVDRFLLSNAGSGAISLYYLGQQIYMAGTEVINRAVANPLITRLSKLHQNNAPREFRAAYQRALLLVGVISIASVVFLLLIGKPVLALLFGHGRLSAQEVSLLWKIMILMSGQFIVGNIGSVMTSMLYSVGETRAPTKAGMLAYSIGIPLKVVLFHFMGVFGLALGVSFYFLVSLAFLILAIRRSDHV